MPNFNVHWVVAMEAIDAAPDFVRRGAVAWEQAAAHYLKALKQAVAEANVFTAPNIVTTLQGVRRSWLRMLSRSPAYDDMTCFSAYMLGACGPDFWTVPSGALRTASHHFDLGHYNRTHRQFEISVGRVARGTSLQAKAEQAYFSGMAAHIGGDTVIHQLVNVSAGAYNLLKYLWSGEQGALKGAKKWNIHNKVEHYWDTYVRHRYLGDWGPVFGEADATPWATPRRLPLVHRLYEEAKRHKSEGLRRDLSFQLGNPLVTYVVEKPLEYPWLFCDRVLDGDIEPFIYRVVVDKDVGAYPRDVMYEAAVKEASTTQMGFFTYDEADKLGFFRSSTNTGDGPTSFNYLNYFVCPDLEKVQRWAKDVFYELAALGAFTRAAKEVAGRFVRSLNQAYLTGRVEDLGTLGSFWNLDTGLGLAVQRVKSDTPSEVTTRLHFVHVLEDRPGLLEFTRSDPHIPGGKNPLAYDWSARESFRLYDAGPFERVGKIQEEPGKAGALEYLRRLRLTNAVPEPAPRGEKIDPSIFFGTLVQPPAPKTCVATASTKAVNELELCQVQHRLTLQLHVGLHDLGAGAADVGMALYAHRAGDDVAPPWTGEAKEWLESDASVIERHRRSAGQVGPLRFFETALLVNLDKRKDRPREVDPGKWNNVIPWDAHKGHYGRNFAISTGRTHVLHPSAGPAGKGTFDGARAFDYYEDVSPTEHVFFSLFALVKTADGVHDAFSKKPVAQADLTAMKKIDALGFVKIVLFYVIGGDGALQLDECLVDGMRVPVREAPAGGACR